MFAPNQKSFHEKIFIYMFSFYLILSLSQAAAKQFNSNKGIIKSIIILS